MVDISPINFYLGLKIEHDWEKITIKLFQPVYINKVLEKYHLNKANAIITPLKKTKCLMLKTDGDTILSKRETY